jgi:hypothetical protein
MSACDAAPHSLASPSTRGPAALNRRAHLDLLTELGLDCGPRRAGLGARGRERLEPLGLRKRVFDQLAELPLLARRARRLHKVEQSVQAGFVVAEGADFVARGFLSCREVA